MVDRTTLVDYCNTFLATDAFQDYCPNGLQVEGSNQVNRIITGVTASQNMVDAAVQAGGDLLLVHHGYFWKGESAAIVGIKQRRLKSLLQNDLNLLAYHLPLDVHAEVGNNVQLARLMGWQITGPLEVGNPRSVGLVGELPAAQTGEQLAQSLARALDREPLFIAGHQRPVKRIAWCTGAAQGYIDKAIALGADAFVTGEVSEPTVHAARENGIHFYAAGHHATERYGVQALGAHLAEVFGVQHQFIDMDNPV